MRFVRTIGVRIRSFSAPRSPNPLGSKDRIRLYCVQTRYSSVLIETVEHPLTKGLSTQLKQQPLRQTPMLSLPDEDKRGCYHSRYLCTYPVQVMGGMMPDTVLRPEGF